MNTSLEHLPIERQVQLKTIIRRIKNTLNPEKLILYGLFATKENGFDYKGTLPPTHVNNFDILLVTRRNSQTYDYEVQDIIESSFLKTSPVNVSVYDIDYVNSQLQKGQYFFYMLYHEAILIYDAGYTPLNIPAAWDLPAIIRMAKIDFETWYHQAKIFSDLANYARGLGELKISVFLLHQAAEHTYAAILLSFCGLKPPTHNLDKLRRLTNRFSIELSLIFPRNTEYEDLLFKTLLTAYIRSRYDSDYIITKNLLNVLVTRIDQLLTISQQICNNRFLTLNKMAAL